MDNDSLLLPPTARQDYPDPIPGVLPFGSVCIVSGASGAGKTILLAMALAAIRAGQPFCGRTTNQQTGYGIIAADRDWSTYETIYTRIGFPDIPRYVLAADKDFDPRDWEKKSNALTLFERCIVTLDPIPGSLVFCDPIAPLFIQGNQNDSRAVALSLHWYRKIAQRFQITLALFANVGKPKVEEQYRRAQDRIAGSGAFVAYSDTQISVEQSDEGIVSMRWTPRLEAPAEHCFRFNPETGLFSPHATEHEADQTIGGVTLPAHLARIFQLVPEKGTIVSPDIVRLAGKDLQLKRSIVFKHLQKLIELGHVERDDLGVLKRRKSIH